MSFLKKTVSELIHSYIAESAKLIEECQQFKPELFEISHLLFQTFEKGGKILIAGNGGSCSDAQHIAGELISKYRKTRKGIPVITLPTNFTVLTAVSNDFDFKDALAREVDTFGKKGDIFWAISTSGNSQNLIKAIHIAKSRGMKIVGFSGKTGGEMKELCDILVTVPHEDTPIIQQCHITMAHVICDLLERQLPQRDYLPAVKVLKNKKSLKHILKKIEKE